MTVGVEILNLAVVGPLVGNIEGGGDRASVGVDAIALKQILVQLLVQVIHGVVESQQHNLRYLLNRHVSFMR